MYMYVCVYIYIYIYTHNHMCVYMYICIVHYSISYYRISYHYVSYYSVMYYSILKIPYICGEAELCFVVRLPCVSTFFQSFTGTSPDISGNYPLRVDWSL